MKKIEFPKLNSLFSRKNSNNVPQTPIPENKQCEASSLNAMSNYGKAIINAQPQALPICTNITPLTPNKPYMVSGKDTIEIGKSKFKLDDKLSNVPNGTYLIGRGNDCNVILDDVKISRKHLEVIKTNQGYIVKDLDSMNGTIVKKNNLGNFIQNDSIDIEKACMDLFGKKLPDGIDEWQSLGLDVYCRIRETGKYKKNYSTENYDSEANINKVVKDINGEIDKEKGVYVFDGNTNWAYRKVAGKGIRETEEISSRMSANVIPNANMINQLDNFLKTGEYEHCGKKIKVDNYTQCYYKTPLEYKNWNNRQDPITFYFYGKASPEVQLALARITQPYARGGVFGGSVGANWISQNVEEPSEESINDLIDSFKEIGFNNGAYAIENSKGGRRGTLSAGQLEAYRQIYEYCKKLKMPE